MNRLPSFEDTPSNQAAVVVLRGMQDDDQVEALLRAWMEPHRNGGVASDELLPFTWDSLTVLRRVSEGRPGILLNRAHELFEAAAEEQRGMIDADFAREYFAGSGVHQRSLLELEDEPASDVVDLLA